MDVALEGAGAGITLHPADRLPRAASRPFGPLPRAAVAVYGFLLAAAGLTLCYLAGGHPNGFGAAGANALLLGLGCIVLAVRAGRPPREASWDVEPDAADGTTDAQRAAARVVTELADLERQLDELTEQCATFDVQWADQDPGMSARADQSPDTSARADQGPGAPIVVAPRGRARAAGDAS